MDARNAPSLVAASVGFNLAPIATIDPSWLKAMAHGSLISRLRESTTAQSWLSRYLLDKFDLTDNYWTDFEAPRTRLALLDRHILQTLLLRLGLVLRGDEVRREVDGARLKNLAARIGPEHLSFAFRTTPLLGRPPAFDYEPEVSEPRLHYMMLGAAFALPAAAMGVSAYATRIALRLPCDLRDELYGLAARRGAADEVALPALARRILREVGSSWLPLFG